MKTQHIKFEILKEKLILFYCNRIRRIFVLNMFSIGRIYTENFHSFGDVMDDVTKFWTFAFDSIVSKPLAFDRANDLHFRIQTNFGHISSTHQ